MGLFNMAEVKVIENVYANINPYPLKGEMKKNFAKIILEYF
jgi:hypothetical protein